MRAGSPTGLTNDPFAGRLQKMREARSASLGAPEMDVGALTTKASVSLMAATQDATGRRPCPTCPWLKSSTIGGADIPGFSLELMRGLANTVGRGDDFRPIMACHGSACGAERICVGYAAVEGYSNISVRLMAIRGEVDLAGIGDACADLELWDSFEVMLAAYEDAVG